MSWQDKLFGAKSSPYLALGRLGNSHPWVWIIGIILIWVGSNILARFTVNVGNTFITIFLPELYHGLNDDRAQINSLDIYFQIIYYGLWIVSVFSCLWLAQKLLRGRPFSELITARLRFSLKRFIVATCISLIVISISYILCEMIERNFGSVSTLEFNGVKAIKTEGEIDISKILSIPVIIILCFFASLTFTAFVHGFILQGLSQFSKNKLFLIAGASLFALAYYSYPYFYLAPSTLPEIIGSIGFYLFFAYIIIIDKGLEFSIGVYFADEIIYELIIAQTYTFFSSSTIFSDYSDQTYTDTTLAILSYGVIAAIAWKLRVPIKPGDNIEDIYD